MVVVVVVAAAWVESMVVGRDCASECVWFMVVLVMLVGVHSEGPRPGQGWTAGPHAGRQMKLNLRMM